MKKIIPILALLLLVPVVSAKETQRSHVHDLYEVTISTDVAVGASTQLEQLSWFCSVTYDPVLPDSDEFNGVDEVNAYVGVTCNGPGTVLFPTGTAPTVDPFTFQASDACTVVEDFETTGASLAARWVAAGYLVSFDRNSPDREKCTTQLIINQDDGGETWQVLIPIVIYNDDPEPSRFERIFGVSGDEAASLLTPLMLLVAVVIFCGPGLMRYTLAGFLMIMGIVLLVAATGLPLLILGGFALVGGALKAVLTIFESRPTVPPKFQ